MTIRPRTQWLGRNGNGGRKSPRGTDPSAFNGHPGRPPVYNPGTHPQRAYKILSREGVSLETLALAFGVSDGVLSQWKNQHPEFLRAITEGMWAWNTGAVTKSLVKRAVGFTVEEEKLFLDANGDLTRREVMKKYYPPDSTSMIFWLTNRSKEYWQHVNRVEHTGKDGKPIQTEDAVTQTLLRELLSKADLEALVGLKDTLENITCANTAPC